MAILKCFGGIGPVHQVFFVNQRETYTKFGGSGENVFCSSAHNCLYFFCDQYRQGEALKLTKNGYFK